MKYNKQHHMQEKAQMKMRLQSQDNFIDDEDLDLGRRRPLGPMVTEDCMMLEQQRKTLR